MKSNQWWRGAVIYQVYPRSFCDSSGNGIGDLPGVISKIPYIASLGVDAIWLSPFFTSPMKDFGYDVSDYLDVDPTFGTLDDFKLLVITAHEYGLKVIIDQVLSHTSDQHPWFEQSKSDLINDKSDWYVWADPKADGTAPNNWLSFFGGSAWTFDPTRRQYYLHNFLSSQPDLNYHNIEVQDAVLDVLRFWLDIGVDGFRLDTVNMYFCDKDLRSNPPRDPNVPIGGMNSSNPRAFQDQLFNVNRPENKTFLTRIRQLLEQYDDRTTLGEIGSVEDTIGMMADYTSGDEHLHMCYTADLLSENSSASYVREVINKTQARIDDGWPCWSLGNHDSVRFASRWGANVSQNQKIAFNKSMLSLIAALRGSICIYQGEELGLEESELSFDDLVDPFGIAFWPNYKGRDGCRTPMAWNTTPSAGFSETTDTWLPIDQQHREQSPVVQSDDPNSVLYFFQELMKLRRNYPALIAGDINQVCDIDDLLVFERFTADQRLFIAINMSGSDKSYAVDKRISAVKEHSDSIALANQFATIDSSNVINFKPWQIFIADYK